MASGTGIVIGGCRIQPGGVIVPPLLLIAIVISSFPFPSQAADTLYKGQHISTNESLVSAGGRFRLGFFLLGNSPPRYYLGIWYDNLNTSSPTVVWVANRERPLTDPATGILTIADNGTLAVVDAAAAVYWSSSSSSSSNVSTVDWGNSSARLEDSGDFVLRTGDGSRTLWQSFDHPTDTFIPGMTITSDGRRFVSWRSPDDPAPGRFSLGLDPSAQLYMWNGSEIRWRSGQWDRVSFMGITRMVPLSLYGFSLDPGDMSLSFSSPPGSSLVRFVMEWNGVERTYNWSQETQAWSPVWFQPVTECETYDFCGSYGICINASACSCLRGFVPRSESEWSGGNRSGGCLRRIPLGCRSSNNTNSSSSAGGGAGDNFARFDNVKLPDFSETMLRASDPAACAAVCSGDCSCTAYAYVTALGCMVWDRDLVDVAQFSGANGHSLFVKLAGGEFAESVPTTSEEKSKTWILWTVLPPVSFLVILCVALYLCWRHRTKIKVGWWKKNGEEARMATTVGPGVGGGGQGFSGPRVQLEEEEEHKEAKPSDLPMFSFDAIAAATDNFSDSNKLGQGGFGHVYKGVLPGGEEIAVKRLSRSSGQGVDEFKNELTLIAKLQHRNLVKLLGCCIHGQEKLLIYEYMPNKSLDSFLFNPARQPMLDWSKRFDIIEGIARGILYLHRDSRLRVVHRDLKASNILLDEEMNPKISDFGMARIFGGNQNHDNTNRVVGTFGYMSPEYAMEGLFSVKSDVYSFGVLMLEIVSGRKNSRTRSDSYTNLLGYVWQLWTAERAEEIIDPCIRGSCQTRQVLRCIHIGLLCVQDRAYDRPTMSSVVIMLGSGDGAVHQMPKQPTFAAEGSPSETECSQKHDGDGYSVNDVTITILTGR